MLLRFLGILLLFCWLFWRGYRRRRGHWTPRSWRRFAALLSVAIAIEVVGTIMAIGVDRGVYAGMSPLEHKAYFYTLMTLSLASPIAFSILLWWFADGRPDRQL